jgi:hypothetical protein
MKSDEAVGPDGVVGLPPPQALAKAKSVRQTAKPLILFELERSSANLPHPDPDPY